MAAWRDMSLQPIVSQRLYQQVAESIKQQIQSGTLAAGERLPSEKVLAQQLGVSRPTVREAMIALEIAGLVEIRSGSGSYVREKSVGLTPTIDTGPGPIELLKARMLIEGEVAAEAAARASKRDLALIKNSIEQMEFMMASGEHGRSADQSFHVNIARASGNDVLASIVGNLWEGMFSPLFSKLSERTHLVSRQEAALKDHKAIFAALSTRDSIGARAAMRQHLTKVQNILSDADLFQE
ncbi:MAG: FadR/GntR family transcriptional regulator [Acidobacteriaceae bacterium]